MEVDTSEMLRMLSALRDCSRHVERGVREHPLDQVDVGILALAEAEDGELRPSQAAAALEIAAPSVTRHVRSLQRAEYLTIQPDAEDRRGYRIGVSAAGAAALSEFRGNLVATFAPVLAGWSTAEVSELADGLTRLGAAMQTALESQPVRPAGASWWRAGESTVDGGQS